MTNNEVIEIVFKTYKIKSLIRKIINNSSFDQSYKDLEQIIYLQLLTMDNEKLNHLFDTNGLRKWISQIAKNQRNYYKNHYKQTVLKDNIPISEGHLELLDNEHNYVLDWLDEELDKYNWDDLISKEEVDMCGNYEILKFYLSSGYSMKRISKLFNCSTTKINNMIISAKENIKLSYEKDFDKWIEKIKGKI